MNYQIIFKRDNNNCYFQALNSEGEIIGNLILEINHPTCYYRFKSLCNGRKCAYLVSIKTNYFYTKQGIATALLNEAIKTFYDYNIYLWVKPSRRGNNDKSFEQLKKFYSQFGFFQTNELDPTMFRKATIND